MMKNLTGRAEKDAQRLLQAYTVGNIDRGLFVGSLRRSRRPLPGAGSNNSGDCSPRLRRGRASLCLITVDPKFPSDRGDTPDEGSRDGPRVRSTYGHAGDSSHRGGDVAGRAPSLRRHDGQHARSRRLDSRTRSRRLRTVPVVEPRRAGLAHRS